MTTRCHRHPAHALPCRECARTRPAVIQAAYDALHHRTQPPVPRVTQPALDEDEQRAATG